MFLSMQLHSDLNSSSTKTPHVLSQPLLHIILDRPKIAANIASIVRLSASFQAVLHVCGPLVFDQGDKTKWRAGLDYFYGARVHFHQDIFSCLQLLGDIEPWIIEVGGEKAPWDVSFESGAIVIFGPEDGSVNDLICNRYQERIVSIPQYGPVRSLNLAQCVAMVTAEATRQLQDKNK